VKGLPMGVYSDVTEGSHPRATDPENHQSTKSLNN
jgi:hypothetical protein